MSDNKNLPQPAKTQAAALADDKFERSHLQDWHKSIDAAENPALKFGKNTVLGLLAIFCLWGCVADLDGAVVGSGRIIAEDRNRVIQHLEGGILRELHVREGDAVKAGDILAVLDDTQSGSQLQASQLQQAIYRVQLARYRTEVNEGDVISMPSDFPDAIVNEPRLMEAIESQRSEFQAQRRVLNAELEIIDNQITAQESDKTGQQAILAAYDRQFALYNRELADFKDLLEKGLVKRTQVFETERRVAELEARIATTRLEIKKADNNVISLNNQKKQTLLKYLKDANNAVVQIQQRLNETDSRVERLEDIIARGRIKSPVDGTVFRVATRTLGAVVRPGDPIMEVFPDNDALHLEAFIMVNDIEQVHLGQDVNVTFPSNREKAMTPIDGKVIYVSADAVVSEQYPMGAYVAHVEIDPNQTEQDIFAGNFAQVYFMTEPKTFFQFISEPVLRSAFNAFKG